MRLGSQRGSWKENVGPSGATGNDQGSVLEVWPAFVPKIFSLWVLLDIVIPGRGCCWGNAGTGFVVPSPAGNLLDSKDCAINLA